MSRNLRFGDLNGDGKIDVLIPQQKRHGQGDSYSEVGCLTAMTFDGERLWQNGLADSWNDKLTNDVAVQVHDLDGDGKNEVVYCRDFEIVVADGATGKTIRSVPTPETPKDPDPLKRGPRFPRILGDSMPSPTCAARDTSATSSSRIATATSGPSMTSSSSYGR